MKYKARNECCKKGGKEIWVSAQKVEQKENGQSALLPGLRKHCQGTERSPSSNMIHPEDRYTSQGRYELTKTLRANLFHSGFAWTYVNIEDGEPFCFCGKHNLLNGQMYSCQRYEVARSWTKRKQTIYPPMSFAGFFYPPMSFVRFSFILPCPLLHFLLSSHVLC